MSRKTPRPSAMTRAQFVDAFGHVYEHSSWIAETAFDRGLDDRHDEAEGLASLMAEIIDAADEEVKLALLRAHPDLAGKLAVRGALTAASSSEQASARLDQCSAAEFTAFTGLNNRYREKFGFPFILAVRDHDRAGILRLFAARVDNSPADEFAEALKQVNRIAALRIGDVLSAGDDDER